MATNLILPDCMAPSNLHLRSSVKTRYVDGDMFNICERLAEVSPRLYLVELEDGDSHTYAVMESADDGVQMLVRKYDAADARMIEDVQRMLRIPFEHRFAAIEAENEAFEKAHHENELEMVYEKMGHAFRRQLWADGFIDSRGVSYPTVGVTSRGARAR